MKKFLVLLTVVILFCFSTTAMAMMKIKLSVVTKPGSAQNIAAEKFKELIEQRSKDEIKVKIYHSASLGNETEILQQVQMNTVQMAIITGGPFDTFDPIARVVNYPFLFKDNAQADKILDGPLGAEILKSLESSGFKGLCFSENGFSFFRRCRDIARNCHRQAGRDKRVNNSGSVYYYSKKSILNRAKIASKHNVYCICTD